MNIKILDSWLRDYLKTDASPQQIAEIMSLTSVSIEKVEKLENDYLYDIEVTTNRPDLMSVIGLAREASVALPQAGFKAEFKYKKPAPPKNIVTRSPLIKIKNDTRLVRRICAAVLEVKIKASPESITKRLETSDIRSLNNVIDITNYIMRETGHPAHVFDYDRLTTQQLIIRESQKNEKLTTLDNKIHSLPGRDIIADDGTGQIVDLLGIMGTANSVVESSTKQILFFIDNLDPEYVRKTSMSLGIRTEAAILNEKDIDPSLSMDVFIRGLELFKQIADGHMVSEIIDIYPHKSNSREIVLMKEKVTKVIGIKISDEKIINILTNLGLQTTHENESFKVVVPPIRSKDLQIPEDLIEEIARIYGYHNLPSALAPLSILSSATYTDTFYWEERIKNAMKYWGFTEIYTYSMVSENMFEGELNEAIEIQNPLSQDWVYMRKTLVPSLLKAIEENPLRDELKIFEISNVYIKKGSDLPNEILSFACIIKKPGITFFEVKGLLEQLFYDLGIQRINFKDTQDRNIDIYIDSEKIGMIEILDKNLIDFECNLEKLIKYTTNKKTYIPYPKYPPILEDMAFSITENSKVGDIIELIKKQSNLIKNVILYDKYQNTRTFRITYQDPNKNLTTEDVTPIREGILKALNKINVQLK